MEKTKGQIEDSITKSVISFYRENMGIGPEQAKTYIIEDLVLVRVKGKLSPLEKKLLEDEDGISLIKDIRKKFHELSTKKLGLLIEGITNQKVISSHSDISTKTGEMMNVFVLEKNFEGFFK